MITFLTLALGLLIILALRHFGHPAAIDRGDPTGSPKRPWWNLHSKWHLIGGALAALAPGYADGWWAGLVVGFMLGVALELAQLRPRDRSPSARPGEKGYGYLEPSDLLWNFLGAFVGAFVGAFARGWIV